MRISDWSSDVCSSDLISHQWVLTLSKNAREDDKDVRVGARLVEALRAVQASDSRYAGIMVQEMPCLFACTESCTMHLRAPGKVGYVLGRFTPDAEAAGAILAYAVPYSASGHDRVRFQQSPQGVKDRKGVG